MTIANLYNDQDLLLRISEGNENAFGQLYEAWYDRVYGTALLVSKSPDLASDIVQDVFLLLWKDREKLSAIKQLSSFLFITTRNMVYSKLKRRGFESSYQSYLQTYTYNTNTIDHTPDNLRIKELKRLLDHAVSQLPLQQQRAFRLSRDQGLKHDQIALEMGISPLTVKDYIVRALAFLRTYLKETDTIFCLFIYWVLQKP